MFEVAETGLAQDLPTRRSRRLAAQSGTAAPEPAPATLAARWDMSWREAGQSERTSLQDFRRYEAAVRGRRAAEAVSQVPTTAAGIRYVLATSNVAELRVANHGRRYSPEVVVMGSSKPGPVREAHAPVAPTRPHRHQVRPARKPVQRAWAPRAAVVATLAIGTIAFPALHTATSQAEDFVTAAGGSALALETDLSATLATASTAGVLGSLGPSPLQILTETDQTATEVPGLSQVVPSDTRLAETASRSMTRSSLPDCDASAAVTGTNGRLSSTSLCTVGGFKLQPAAAVAFAEMSAAYELEFGVPLEIVSAYRTYSEQVSVKATKGSLAAPPGTSNHGWGLAVDLSSSSYSGTAQWRWLKNNAATYGWVNPDWAKTTKYEPWHWEYLPGTSALS